MKRGMGLPRPTEAWGALTGWPTTWDALVRCTDAEILTLDGWGPKQLRKLREEYAPRVVVTRHAALVEYLAEIGLVPDGVRTIAHASEADVQGAHVFGVLPLRLAALAWMVTEVPLNLPAELRGTELNLEQARQYAGEPATYSVKRK